MSKVSRNGGDFVLELDSSFSESLLSPTRTNWVFNGWYNKARNAYGVYDNSREELAADTIYDKAVFYADWLDRVKPSLEVSSTNNISSVQTVTLSAADEASGVAGYYVGKTNPDATAVSYTPSTSGTYTANVNSSGVWYFSVKDFYGNATTKSMEFQAITLSGNGGTVSPTTIIAQKNAAVYLPKATRDRYYFQGWSENSAATGGVTSITANRDYTLYATWKMSNYTLTYDANGGSVAVASKMLAEGDPYGTLPTPDLRPGYEFKGWGTAASSGVNVSASTPMGAADTTIYAQWDICSYKLSYDVNGGNALTTTSKQVAYGSAYGTLPKPTRTGYKFKGWGTATSSGVNVSASTPMGAADTTIYAQWQSEKVTLEITTDEAYKTDFVYTDSSGSNYYNYHSKSSSVNLGKAAKIQITSAAPAAGDITMWFHITGISGKSGEYSTIVNLASGNMIYECNENATVYLEAVRSAHDYNTSSKGSKITIKVLDWSD